MYIASLCTGEGMKSFSFRELSFTLLASAELIGYVRRPRASSRSLIWPRSASF